MQIQFLFCLWFQVVIHWWSPEAPAWVDALPCQVLGSLYKLDGAIALLPSFAHTEPSDLFPM